MSLELKAAPSTRTGYGTSNPAGRRLQQAEPAGGSRTSHPSTVDTFQTCRGSKLKHRPILCHLSQAAKDRHPSNPPGRSPFGDSLFARPGIYTYSESPAHTHPTDLALARRLRKPHHAYTMGFISGILYGQFKPTRRSNAHAPVTNTA